MTVESILIATASTTLRELTDRIAICLNKLTDEQVWSRSTKNENAVGNLVLHLDGNVRQWLVSGLTGTPDTRRRDLEFDTEGGISAAALEARLRTTIKEAATVVSGLNTEQLLRTYHIQNRSATGAEAVLKVTEHFAQHAGQIIYATKNLTGEDLGLVAPRAKK